MTRRHIIDNPVPGLDVAIVGAGPAGARAACRLASAGARVTLFDATHPREKPCGGGVTGRALDLVAPTTPAIASVPAVRVETARFESEGRPDAIVDLAPRRPASNAALVVASRRDFDGVLLAAALEAGARLRRERVVAVEVRSDGVELRTATGGCTRASLVIAADGANSLVRRHVATPFARHQLSIATGYFVHGVSTREIVIRFTSQPPGYCWSFPRPDHLAVGICAPADRCDVTSLRRDVEDWIGRQVRATDVRLERYSWPIPSLDGSDIDVERPAGDRWLLLGDAAGLVDPVTREGIYFALQSADLASTAIASERDPGSAYAAALRDGIYGELRRAARFERAFFSPRFLRLLHDALRQRPGVQAVMADLVAGRQPYRGLRRRLLATMELGLAWRLLSRTG